MPGCGRTHRSKSNRGGEDASEKAPPQDPAPSTPITVQSPEPTQKTLTLTEMREKVKNIFAKECDSCHANGKNLGNFGYSNDLERLVKSPERFVVAGKPEESLVYRRMMATDPAMSMPPKGLLPQDTVSLVRDWIVMESPNKERNIISLKAAFKTMKDDFVLQQDRANIRYIHFISLWNGGMGDDQIQLHREALSKLLNMLSTKTSIIKPVSIDNNQLIFRINLTDYGLDTPYGMSTPSKADARIGRWKEVFEGRRPARNTAEEDAYFAALYQVKPPEYSFADLESPCAKPPRAEPRLYLCDENIAYMRSVMTQSNPTELDNDPVLLQYKKSSGLQKEILLREAPDQILMPNLTSTPATRGEIRFGTPFLHLVTSEKLVPGVAPVEKFNPNLPIDPQDSSNPLRYSTEHMPIPVMRGEWFLHQVAANYKQRVYYHLAGIPDDTGVLDIALGIDDEGSLMRDNAPDLHNNRVAPVIMRSGFTNSGVSAFHRVLERIETQQYPGKALWRSYEFGSTAESNYYDVLSYPFGPTLFPSEPGALGYECINMFSNPNDLFKDPITLAPFPNWATLYWTQTPIIFDSLRPTKFGLMSEYNSLNNADKKIYDTYWTISANPTTPTLAVNTAKSDTQLPPNLRGKVMNCDNIKNGKNIHETDRVFKFHGFEYFFIRPNGLPGFATVADNAMIVDTKIIPKGDVKKRDDNMVLVDGAIIQPVSCLSCHTRGLIPKDDQVRDFIEKYSQDTPTTTKKFEQYHVDKARRIYVEKDKIRATMQQDNDIISKSVTATGTKLTDNEPITVAFRSYNEDMPVALVAATVGVSNLTLLEIINLASRSTREEDRRLAQDLQSLNLGRGDAIRSLVERHLRRLIELAVEHKKL